MKPFNKPLSRRDFLKSSVAAAAGIPLINQNDISSKGGGGNPPNHVLRIAHISDIHFDLGKNAFRGLAAALMDIQSLNPLPNVIFNTGDSIMDSLYADKEWTQLQWEYFNLWWSQYCTLPYYHCIGNHDVWGWGYKDTDPSIVDDPLFGKNMAVWALNLPGRYYSFDLAGWHFIMLDSTHVVEVEEPFTCYIAKLDDEQFDWLELELRTNHNTPVCILSHIAILAANEFLDGINETPDYWMVPAAWLHIDARRLRDLFMKHENVKLCLSGHSHMQEELIFTRVKYLNDGAICGGWWSGDYMGFPPGYVIVDLYDDGSSTSEYRLY